MFEQRFSFVEWRPGRLDLGLLLVHHLSRGSNVPLPKECGFFDRNCVPEVVEFASEGDVRYRRAPAAFEDILDDGGHGGFESSARRLFGLVSSHGVRGSERVPSLPRRGSGD